MKKLILSLIVAFAALGVQAQKQEIQAASAQNNWLTEFGAVEIKGAMKVTFVRVPETEAPKIAYDTKGSYTSKFSAEVNKSKVLQITERIEARRESTTEVTVYCHALDRIRVESATVEFRDTLSARMLDISLVGEASLTALLRIDDLLLDIAGKSRAVLTGAVRYLDVEASTSTLDAEQLQVVSAQVLASHSAEVRLAVTDRLEARTSTGATVTYRGTPGIIRGGASFMGGAILPVK